jgi:hypothetical protein
MFVTHQQTKFSAMCVFPFHCTDDHELLPYRYDFDTGNTSFGEDPNTIMETEADWLDNIEPVNRPPAKTSNTLLLEVSS